MYFSSEGLLVILLVGLAAGWLAGQIIQGIGFGLIVDMLLGVIGAFIGGWFMPQLGLRIGEGIIAATINSTIGAMILLVFIKLLVGGGGRSGFGLKHR